MAKTTIQLSDETKDRLDKRKHENESYDTAVNRILDDNPGVLFTEDEIKRMARSVVDDEIQKLNAGSRL